MWVGAPLTDGLVADAGDRVGPSQFIGVSGSFSIDVGSGDLVPAIGPTGWIGHRRRGRAER